MKAEKSEVHDTRINYKSCQKEGKTEKKGQKKRKEKSMAAMPIKAKLKQETHTSLRFPPHRNKN